MLVKTIEELRAKVKEWKKQGLTVGLVPTMGALHAGHLSLIKKAKANTDKVVVSVFVNPIQFGPSEDFDKYPRTLDADEKLCNGEGVDIVFAPSPAEMYNGGGKCKPEGSSDSMPEEIGGKCNPESSSDAKPEEILGNRLSNDTLTYVCPPFFYVNKLCGKTRVGHFDGVCTVVLKLFNIVQPDKAFFGQKDAQQVVVIRKMVKDLNVPVEITQCPIVREESGLALSSRNKYLSDEGKKDALVLSKILNNIKACYKKGITDVGALKETAYSYLTDKHDMEYLEILDRDTLEDKEKADDNTIALIACRVEGVRLIDNIYLGD